MKESLGYTLVIAIALSSYRLLEATTLPLNLVQNVGTLNNSSGWIRVRPQDPVTVACTSSCGLVEWTVIPNSAIQNITVLSRTDQRCNSTTGVCVNDYSEPCPGEESEYMLFKLSLKTTVTVIIQCNAYVIFKTDLTIRHMIRGDSFLVIAEEEEEESIAVSPSPQAVTPSSTLSVNECIQTSSSVTTASDSSHTSSQLTPGLTFTSYAAITKSTFLPAPTTMAPTLGFGLSASPDVVNQMAITGSSIPVTLCSFNSYLIVTVVLGGLLLLSLIALFITCICCKYSSSRTVVKSDDLATTSMDAVSPLSHTSHFSSAYHDSSRVRSSSSRELDIIEYSDPSDLPISTTV